MVFLPAALFVEINIHPHLLVSFIKNDKKVENGKLNMVMLKGPGRAEIGEIGFQQMRMYINLYKEGSRKENH